MAQYDIILHKQDDNNTWETETINLSGATTRALVANSEGTIEAASNVIINPHLILTSGDLVVQSLAGAPGEPCYLDSQGGLQRESPSVHIDAPPIMGNSADPHARAAITEIINLLRAKKLIVSI